LVFKDDKGTDKLLVQYALPSESLHVYDSNEDGVYKELHDELKVEGGV